MRLFTLITDSTIDETPDFFAKHDLPYVSLSFTIDDVSHPEDCGQAVSFPQFYDLLRNGKKATTSQVTLDAFLKTFRPILEAGSDILYLAFSSGLSGTYATGCIARDELAAEFPERKIICVDSLSATGGQQIMVTRALKMRDGGRSIEEAVESLEQLRYRVIHLITINDLDHLYRGGRLSKTSAVFGGLLGIKPVIYVNNEGKLEICQKIRGRQKSLEYLGDRMIREIADKNEVVQICHGDCLEDAQYLAGYIQKNAGIRSEIRYVGTVIGSHTGPGVIILTYTGTERNP